MDYLCRWCVGNPVGGLGSEYFLTKKVIGMPMSLFWVMPIMLLYRLVDLGTPLFSISECSWDSSNWDVSLFQSLAP
ncbi:MAG: hypothetical protein CL930_16535 [Deltaproteobacteria bacterium]|nr:hypothetical protein [Deltaproteobacteria bacterium]